MKLDSFRYESSVGAIHCFFLDSCLVDLSLGEEPVMPAARRLSPEMRSFMRQLDDYFKGKLKEFTVQVRLLSGTPFERKVWLALLDIPYGETRSYKWIAGRAGNVKAVRAAGQALRKNPLPIVFPCHRVIASDGSPGGFSCGVEIKERLLELEKRNKK
jgi:methylated-DNA-[protein]-cysteine S-methyltransferase